MSDKFGGIPVDENVGESPMSQDNTTDAFGGIAVSTPEVKPVEAEPVVQTETSVDDGDSFGGLPVNDLQTAGEQIAQTPKSTTLLEDINDLGTRFGEGAVADGALSIVEGLSRFAGNNKKFLSPVGYYLGESLDLHPELAVANKVGEFRDWLHAGSNRDKSKDDEFLSQVAGGLGQQATSLPAYLIAPLGYAAAIGQTYDEGFRDAKQSGASDEDANIRAVEYLPSAALDYLGDKFLAGKLVPHGEVYKTVRQKATGIVKSAIESFGVEGLTEGLQQVWLDGIAEQYGEKRDIVKNAIDNFLVGGVIGGGIGALGTASTPVERQQQVINQKIVQEAGKDIGPATAQALDDTLTQDESSNIANAFTEEVTDEGASFSARITPQPEVINETAQVQDQNFQPSPTEAPVVDQPTEQTSQEGIQSSEDDITDDTSTESISEVPDTTIRPQKRLSLAPETLETVVINDSNNQVVLGDLIDSRGKVRLGKEAEAKDVLGNLKGITIDDTGKVNVDEDEFLQDNDPDGVIRDQRLGRLQDEFKSYNDYYNREVDQFNISSVIPPSFTDSDLTFMEERGRELGQRQEGEEQADVDASGDTLIDDVINAGGLPVNDQALSGELRAIKEDPSTKLSLFRKGQKLDVDKVREAVNQEGYNFETPAEMLEAIDKALFKRKEKFGSYVGKNKISNARKKKFVGAPAFNLVNDVPVYGKVDDTTAEIIKALTNKSTEAGKIINALGSRIIVEPVAAKGFGVYSFDQDVYIDPEKVARSIAAVKRTRSISPSEIIDAVAMEEAIHNLHDKAIAKMDTNYLVDAFDSLPDNAVLKTVELYDQGRKNGVANEALERAMLGDDSAKKFLYSEHIRQVYQNRKGYNTTEDVYSGKNLTQQDVTVLAKIRDFIRAILAKLKTSNPFIEADLKAMDEILADAKYQPEIRTTPPANYQPSPSFQMDFAFSPVESTDTPVEQDRKTSQGPAIKPIDKLIVSDEDQIKVFNALDSVAGRFFGNNDVLKDEAISKAYYPTLRRANDWVKANGSLDATNKEGQRFGLKNILNQQMTDFLRQRGSRLGQTNNDVVEGSATDLDIEENLKQEGNLEQDQSYQDYKVYKTVNITDSMLDEYDAQQTLAEGSLPETISLGTTREDNPVSPTVEANTPEIEASRNYTKRVLTEAIGRLSPLEQDIAEFQKTFESTNSRSVYQIAKRNGVSYGVVRGMIERGSVLNKLQNLMYEIGRVNDKNYQPAPELTENNNDPDKVQQAESKFYSRVLDDERILRKTREEIEASEIGKYFRKGNKEVQARVNQMMKEADGNVDSLIQKLLSRTLPSSETVQLGMTLSLSLNDQARRWYAEGNDAQGRIVEEKNITVVDFLVEYGTEAGQGVQAFAMWGRLTPEGVLLAYQRQIKKAVASRKEKVAPFTEVAVESLNEANDIGVKRLVQTKAFEDVEKKVDEFVAKKRKRSQPKQNDVATEEESSLWEQYRKSANKNIEGFIDKTLNPKEKPVNPALQDFTKRLVNNIKSELKDVLPEKIKSQPQVTDVQIIKEMLDNPRPYLQTWVDTLRYFEETDPKIAEQLSDAFVSDYGITQDVVDRVIKKDIKLRDLVTAHYTDVVLAGKTLTESLATQLGLSSNQVGVVASAIEERLEKLVTAEKKKRLANILKNSMLNVKEDDKKVIREQVDKIIEMSNLGALDSESTFNAIKDKLNLPTFTPEVAREMKSKAEVMQTLPAGFTRQRAAIDLMNYIAEQKGLASGDIAMGYYYASILSGPMTQFVNGVGNIYNSTSEMVVDFLTFKDPARAGKLISGWFKGLVLSMDEAGALLKKGDYSANYSGKTDSLPTLENVGKAGAKYKLTNTGKLRDIPAFIRAGANAGKYVGRLMSATDLVFYRAANEGKSQAYAYTLAKSEGLRGEALNARVSDLLFNTEQAKKMAENQVNQEGLFEKGSGDYNRRVNELMRQHRPDELIDDANDFALFATYNNRPEGLLGFMASEIGNLNRNTQVSRFVVPFCNIVANVFNIGLSFSPYGYLRANNISIGQTLAEIGDSEKWWKSEYMGEKRAKELWRAHIGTIGSFLLALLAEKFLDDEDPWFAITAGGPTDYAKRKQLEKTGWKQYSIKIGDAYFNYQVTPPFLMFALMGNISDAYRYNKLDREDVYGRAAYALSSIPSVLLNQSFLASLGGVFDAVAGNQSPKELTQNVGKVLNRTASGIVVPNFFRQIDRWFDPSVTDRDSVSMKIMSEIPVVRQAFGKKALNVLGDEMTLYGDGIVDRILGRFVSVEDKDIDPVYKALAKQRTFVSAPKKSALILDHMMNSEEFYDYNRYRGQYIKREIKENLGAFNAMSREEAADFISKASREGSAYAKGTVAESISKRTGTPLTKAVLKIRRKYGTAN